MRSVVCVQIGWRGREWGVFWRLLQEGVWTVKTVESEVRRTRHEGAEKDGDSGVLGMWYEHEYTRGWSRFIVVFSVFFSGLLRVLLNVHILRSRNISLATLTVWSGPLGAAPEP